MITVFGAMRMQVKVCVRGLCAVDVRMDVNPVPAHAGQRPGAHDNQSQPNQRVCAPGEVPGDLPAQQGDERPRGHDE